MERGDVRMIDAVLAGVPAAIGLLFAALPAAFASMALVIKRPLVVPVVFATGWCAGLVAASAAIVGLADLVSIGDRNGPWLNLVKVVAGVVLIGLALRKWLRRNDESTKPRGLMDNVGALRAAAIGFLLASVNPKNLAVVVAGVSSIAAVSTVAVEQVVALVVFVVVGSIGVLAPVVCAAVLGTRAAGMLAAANAWMVRYADVLIAVVLLILGGVVALNGLSGLHDA